MKNNKKNQVASVLKGVLLFSLLAVASGCAGGGGGQQSPSTSNPAGGNTGNTAVPTSTQASLKMDLCDEVNGWATDCRFVGMKFIKQNPEPIIPLTEKHGRNRGRGGREA